MNERIRELAQQVKVIMDGDDDLEFYTEKLAQLIVKECLNQLQESVSLEVTSKQLQGLVNAAGRAALDINISKIKEHFGVEK